MDLLRKIGVPAILFLAVLWVSLLPSHAFSQAPFYKGKTITIVQGRGPGGTGDLRNRALVPFLSRYIPGNPAIAMEYMSGGGGRKAANYIYGTARPDGLTIGNTGAGIVAAAILGERGVAYDLDKLIYLGSSISEFIPVFISRKEAGYNTLEKLRAATGVRIGGQSVGFVTYNEGRIFAWILGLREPRFVTGYSGPELDLALERGEIDARATGVESFLREPDLLKKVDLHAVIEIPKGIKRPEFFAGLPELDTFVKSDLERKAVAMLRAFRGTGAPFFAPPGVPADRVKMLREGFRKAFSDPQFSKELERLSGDSAAPLMPEDHEQLIREIPRDPAVIQVVKQITGSGPLPPR